MPELADSFDSQQLPGARTDTYGETFPPFRGVSHGPAALFAVNLLSSATEGE